MTLPEGGDITLPTRRGAPWEPGWGPIPSAVLYPMMCSRNSVNPRASTIQYHAQSLIYRYVEDSSEFDWHARPEHHVRNKIIRTMPSDVSTLYRILLRGHISYADERRMGPVIEWIHQEGPRLGNRVLSPDERARATGRAQYFRALGLNDVQPYNAVGNHFDPDALRARIRGPLARTTRGGTPPRHQYPTPADLSAMYQAVAREVASSGIPTAPSPFPPDLVRILTATRSSGSTTDPVRPGVDGQRIAAEHGRRAQ